MWGTNPLVSDVCSEVWIPHGYDGGSDVSAVQKALDTCRTNYQFIASQAEHLQRLRSQCATSSQITRQEIRGLEVKLIRLFGQQLACKRRLPVCVALPPELLAFPCLSQWLVVVGLSHEALQIINNKVVTLESLLCLREQNISVIMGTVTNQQANKLFRATQNLKRYTSSLLSSNAESVEVELPLFWDSWEQREKGSCPSSPRAMHHKPHHQNREARSSVSSSDGDNSEVGGSSITSSNCTAISSGVSVCNAHHRSSDESSTPSSPPVSSIVHNSAPPFPSPSTVVPHTPSLTLQIPPSSTPIRDMRYTPPSTPKTAKVSTPPPNKKYLLHPPPLPTNSSIGRSTSHESQLVTGRRTEATDTIGSLTSPPQYTNNKHNNANNEQHFVNAPLSRAHLSRHHSECSHNQEFGSLVASPTRLYHSHMQHHTTSEDDNYNKNAIVPRSPRTPPLSGCMGHNVQHRFVKFINIINIKPSTCNYCHQKFTIIGGLRCKECNFKCHRDCESKVAPACGLPNEFLKIFTDHINYRGPPPVGGISPSHHTENTSSSSLRTPPIIGSSHGHLQASMHIGGPDSSSNTSSCNSSTPSSPALLFPPPSSPGVSKLLPSRRPIQPESAETFHYPEVSKILKDPSWNTYAVRGIPPQATSSVAGIHSLTSTTSSTLSATSSTRSDLLDSDRATLSTNSGSGSTSDSDRTVAERVNSQDSTISEGLGEGGGGSGGDGSSTVKYRAGEGCSRQNSVSHALIEWDIPYDELDKGTIIGRGRFGTVFSGNWHGQVAIKELHMEYGNDQHTLEAFKGEISMFRKTRHQNLVLFMGACMKLPRLAIVTSLCKGNTLYKHIHILRDKFTMGNTISVAQQVAQGMGYLHARGIVHKDLKSKNIFLENGKVVITDFGLVNVTRLCQNTRDGAWLHIPAGWLCYLSPELMRALRVSRKEPHALPHSTSTDVYAYGTVWFELLCGEWPHKGLPPEAIIWQVGRGMKPSVAHLQASRDVKDILMECWSYRPDDRPGFASLQDQLKKLPKKKLARSPSHPIHLSRSAECVF